MSDNVNHPSHYLAHPSGVECITITEAMNFCVGNAVKYLWRAGLKSDDPREDLLKARWYVDRELERLGHVDAGEAIAAPVEAPVARVFNVGDPEPADKETIALSGTGNGTVFGATNRKIRLRWGDYSDDGAYDHPISWWDTHEGKRNTHCDWDFWLTHFGPLTEVL